MAPYAQGGGGGTVLGIPLDAGERVVWFKEHNHTAEKVILWIFGVLFAIVLIGLVFIYLAVTVDKRNPRAHAVTNRRFIYWPGGGHPPQVFALHDMADLEPERQRSSGGGGLLGAAIGAAVSAVANHMANKNSKVDPSYWNRTIAITVITHHGQRIKIPTGHSGKDIGLTLSRCLFAGVAEQLPAVHFNA